MQKLTLDCDRLAVESFPTCNEVRYGPGTVHARELRPTLQTVCDQTLLGTKPTCCPCTP
jgi:hypothetical protein